MPRAGDSVTKVGAEALTLKSFQFFQPLPSGVGLGAAGLCNGCGLAHLVASIWTQEIHSLWWRGTGCCTFMRDLWYFISFGRVLGNTLHLVSVERQLLKWQGRALGSSMEGKRPKRHHFQFSGFLGSEALKSLEQCKTCFFCKLTVHVSTRPWPSRLAFLQIKKSYIPLRPSMWSTLLD